MITGTKPVRPGRGAGRRLALAAALLCLAPACDTDPAPPFVVQGTGALEGLVFFDADRNGAYDPASGDTIVAGATVLARERGSSQTLMNGQATTGADGRFALAALPPGTHDLFIDTTTTPAGVFFCQNPVPVSVVIDLVRFVEVTGRQGCVIPIEEAEATAVGTFVTVQGIVTAAPGQLRSAGDNAYIEDASGGIQLFGGALAGRGIAIGDRIEVSGNMTLFNGESEVAGALRVNEIVPGVTVPQPAQVTTAAVAAAGAPPTAPLQGRFIRLVRAQQQSAFATGGGRNALFDDGSGATEIRIEAGLIAASADVATTFPHNPAAPKCFDITGVVGSFNGTAQVKPRTLADMQEVPCTP
jgi:hypothetical protein